MTSITSSLSTVSKQLRSGIEVKFAPEDYLQTKVSTEQEFYEIWHDKGKLERFALTAIIIDRVADRMISQKNKRIAYGLITPESDEGIENFVNSDNPLDNVFGTLEKYLKKTLVCEAFQEENYIKSLYDNTNFNPEDTYLKRVYTRLTEFSSFYNRHNQKIHPDFVDRNDPFTDMIDGSENAFLWMTDILKNIPTIYAEQVRPIEDPSEMIAIASNSFPLVADLSMMHFYDFMGFKEAVRTWRIDSRNIYTLDGSNGTLRLDFVEEFKEFIPNINFQTYEKMGDKLGCPGMVNFKDDGSPIRKIWDWYVDIADSAYKTLHTAGKL